MDVASRMPEVSASGRLGLVLAVTFLSACSSKGAVDASMASGGAGGAQAGHDGAQAGQGGAQAGGAGEGRSTQARPMAGTPGR